MALSVSQTIALGYVLKPGDLVASMGYPDAVAPLELFRKILGPKYENLQWRPDAEEICRRHGLAMREIPDAESFFELMGACLDVYDIVAERGCEIPVDLNQSMATTRDYDIVLDVGTAEHCFNIAQALINMAGLVKVGGLIIHENPFNTPNHGFYGLNPTLYADFYSANGFVLEECLFVDRQGMCSKVPPTKRFKFTKNDEVNVLAMARRVEKRPFVYPVQTKYKHLIPEVA